MKYHGTTGCDVERPQQEQWEYHGMNLCFGKDSEGEPRGIEEVVHSVAAQLQGVVLVDKEGYW